MSSQSSDSDTANAGTNTDAEVSKLFLFLTFTRHNWYILLTGVLFYGAIGASYPSVGALVAASNEVSSVMLILLLSVLSKTILYLRYLVKVTGTQFSSCPETFRLD